MKKYHRERQVRVIVCTCQILMFICSILWGYKTNANEVQSTYTGKGVRVAIIDSGVDINHEDLKNNIIGGYDFIENKEIYKDGDIEKGHGTHVSGIVAANGKFTGVAKNASLLVYRVLSKNEQKFEENIIKAIEKAIEEEAEVINISLKTPITGRNSKIEEAVKKANDKGIVVIKSNGNYGPDEWTTRDLAASPYVISVANCSGIVEEPVVMFQNEKVILDKVLGSKEFPDVLNDKIYCINNATTENLHNYEVKDRIIFVKTENVYIEDIAQKAKELGAKGLMVGSLEENFKPIQIYDEEASVPTVSVCGNELKKLESIIKNKVYIIKEKVELISENSSRGVGIENFNLKPDICAPGVGIISTAPKSVSESGYIMNSGTSMSAPYISGIVALIKEAHPEWDVDQVRSSLMNNAEVLVDRYGKPYDVVSQGAGKVNLDRAIKTDTFIEPASLSFSVISEDEKPVSIEKKLVIETIGDYAKKYNVTVELEKDIEGINIEYPKEMFIRPNKKANMNIKVTLNKGNEKIGIVGGRIYLENKNDKKVVPFVMTVNPENYPLISSFQAETSVISPNKNGLSEEIEMNYNLPKDVADLRVWVENIDDGEKIDIITRKNLKSGFYNETWNGLSVEGKKLKDGVYSVNIVVGNGKWSTEINGSQVVVLDTVAPTINMRIVNGEVYGCIEDIFIDKNYLIENINKEHDSDLKAVKVYYSTNNKNNYEELPLDKEGKFQLKINTDEYDKIYIKAIDACGNIKLKRFNTK